MCYSVKKRIYTLDRVSFLIILDYRFVITIFEKSLMLKLLLSIFDIIYYKECFNPSEKQLQTYIKVSLRLVPFAYGSKRGCL